MLIFDNLSDINTIYGILSKVGEKYWRNSDEMKSEFTALKVGRIFN